MTSKSKKSGSKVRKWEDRHDFRERMMGRDRAEKAEKRWAFERNMKNVALK